MPTDQLLGNFTFCCQVKFGADDDEWCGLMEGKERIRQRVGGEVIMIRDAAELLESMWVTLTRSSPLRW